MKKSVKYSQNFLENFHIAKNLIISSSINDNDTVIEVGAGGGILTKILLARANKVIAFETDERLFKNLKSRLGKSPNLELKNEDFLNFTLPVNNYKVFSNIPFSLTSDILKKLVYAKNPPRDCYLIVQREAAAKFMGNIGVGGNSQIAVLLYPYFEFSIKHRFNTADFFPKPGVKIVLLRVKKREKPLVNYSNQKKYRDFVVYMFNNQKQILIRLNDIPSRLTFIDWIAAFKQFSKQGNVKIVEGQFDQQLKMQETLKKIKRTRLDKNWRIVK